MIAHRIQPRILDEKRLDPYYYSPGFLTHADLMKLRFSQRLRVGECFEVLDGTHDSVETKAVPDEKFCIPFLRAQDIGSCILNSCEGAFLSRNDHFSKCKRSQIKHGDVLLNIMASTGDSCLYHRGLPASANANRAVGILRMKNSRTINEYQPRYVCSVLSSAVGSKELARNLKGSIQQRLNLEDISDTLIPLVAYEAQIYIGDKVRQAERLRARARKLERGLFEQESSHIPIPAPTESSKKGWKVDKSDATDFRLNPEYFRIHHIEQEKASQRPDFADLNQLVDKFSYGTSTKADYVPIGSGIKFIRGCDLDRNRIRQEEIVYLSNKCLRDVGNNVLGPRDVIITRSGTVGIASAVPDALVGAAYGSFMIKLTIKENWDPIFVSWVLNSWLGQRQIRRLENGAVQLNVNIEELKTIRIWSPSLETQKKISGQVTLCSELQDYLIGLTTAAKLLVEALIEGQITESDLTTAQKALEAGDRTPDREILSRLTRKGMDVTGEPPLFPDLDGLYNALDALNAPEDNP